MKVLRYSLEREIEIAETESIINNLVVNTKYEKDMLYVLDDAILYNGKVLKLEH